MELILVAEDISLLRTFYNLEFNPQIVFQRLTDFFKFQFPFIKNNIIFVDVNLIRDDSLDTLQQLLKAFSLKLILIVDTFKISKKVQEFAIAHCWGIITKNNLNVSLPEIFVESQHNLDLFFKGDAVSALATSSPNDYSSDTIVLEKQFYKSLATESKLQYKITRLSRTIFDLKKQIKYQAYCLIFLIAFCITLLIKIYL